MKNELENTEENNIKVNKESHIGYYLIDKGINQLYQKLEYTAKREETPEIKTKIYLLVISTITITISAIISYLLNLQIKKNHI